MKKRAYISLVILGVLATLASALLRLQTNFKKDAKLSKRNIKQFTQCK